MNAAPGCKKVDSVIYVHGTGAGDPSDEGPRWWQIGSTFDKKIRGMLGEGFRVERPFHWSGANWETARAVAGKALLTRLRELDRLGSSYHLIGHSHGGSVILHALRLSRAAGQEPLRGLRSWTTVGTPFLRYQAERLNWPLMFATSVVVAALAAVSVQFWRYLKDDSWHWIGSWTWIVPIA